MEDLKELLASEIIRNRFDLRDEGDKLADDRLAALIELERRLTDYDKQGFIFQLLEPICKRKVEFIKNVTTKNELREIVFPPKVRRLPSGGFEPVGEFAVPEEELIMWSLASLKAPPSQEAFKRYCELFSQVFPEKAESVLGKTG